MFIFRIVADFLLRYWQGKMDAAASMIEKAIIANPTYAEAYNNLGLYLYLSGVIFYWNFAIHIR